MHAAATSAALFLSFMVSASPLAAQRGTARLVLSGREVVLEYGIAPFGKHSLADLPAGQTWAKDADPVSELRNRGMIRTSHGPAWRLGMNEASVLRTQLPLLAGDTVVPPGSYRAQLYRKSEKELLLILSSGGLALGQNLDLVLPGQLGDAKTPARKLALEWSPAGPSGKDDAQLETRLMVRFGPHELEIPVKVIAARSAKLAGYQVDVFCHEAGWLTDRVAKQLPTPFLTLRTMAAKKERDSFNLVVTGEKCSLLQMMSAPTEMYGFDNPSPPAEQLTTQGTVQSGKAGGNGARTVLEAEKCERDAKGNLALRFVYGEVLSTASLPDATAKLAKR